MKIRFVNLLVLYIDSLIFYLLLCAVSFSQDYKSANNYRNLGLQEGKKGRELVKTNEKEKAIKLFLNAVQCFENSEKSIYPDKHPAYSLPLADDYMQLYLMTNDGTYPEKAFQIYEEWRYSGLDAYRWINYSESAFIHHKNKITSDIKSDSLHVYIEKAEDFLELAWKSIIKLYEVDAWPDSLAASHYDALTWYAHACLEIIPYASYPNIYIPRIENVRKRLLRKHDNSDDFKQVLKDLQIIRFHYPDARLAEQYARGKENSNIVKASAQKTYNQNPNLKDLPNIFKEKADSAEKLLANVAEKAQDDSTKAEIFIIIISMYIDIFNEHKVFEYVEKIAAMENPNSTIPRDCKEAYGTYLYESGDRKSDIKSDSLKVYFFQKASDFTWSDQINACLRLAESYRYKDVEKALEAARKAFDLNPKYRKVIEILDEKTKRIVETRIESTVETYINYLEKCQEYEQARRIREDNKTLLKEIEDLKLKPSSTTEKK